MKRPRFVNNVLGVLYQCLCFLPIFCGGCVAWLHARRTRQQQPVSLAEEEDLDVNLDDDDDDTLQTV